MPVDAAATCWALADAAPLTNAATAQEIKYLAFINNPPEITGYDRPTGMRDGAGRMVIPKSNFAGDWWHQMTLR
jgi:hypothetical protein